MTCLPSGEWSDEMYKCIEISCPEVTFEKLYVDQKVENDPTLDLVGYQTQFILSCGFPDQVFDFGPELNEVEYFCNRR